MTTTVVKVRRLIGKSKAIAAALTTFGLALAGAATDAISTGNVDVTQTRIALGGLVSAVIVYAVTWLVGVDEAEVEIQSAPVERRPGIHSERGLTLLETAVVLLVIAVVVLAFVVLT